MLLSGRSCLEMRENMGKIWGLLADGMLLIPQHLDQGLQQLVRRHVLAREAAFQARLDAWFLTLNRNTYIVYSVSYKLYITM